MNIKFIKNKSEIPETLVPNAVVMNGTNEEISFGQVVTTTGMITSFRGVKTGKSLQRLKVFAESCNCIGALLSYDGSTYTIWNGNPDADDYWDPQGSGVTPSEQYGNILAVCTGNGLWVIKDWYGIDSTMINLDINGSTKEKCQGYMCWAPNGSDLYNTCCGIMTLRDGWTSTNHIFEHHGSEVVSWNHSKIVDGDSFSDWDKYSAALTPIWEQLTKSNIEGIKDWQLDDNGNVTQVGDLYIPSRSELSLIQQNVADTVTQDYEKEGFGFTYNNNMGQLLGLSSNEFWSSSQYPGSYSSAFIVNFGDGGVGSDGKDNYCLSLACLHF